jgi:hypothetical protein
MTNKRKFSCEILILRMLTYLMYMCYVKRGWKLTVEEGLFGPQSTFEEITIQSIFDVGY